MTPTLLRGAIAAASLFGTMLCMTAPAQAAVVVTYPNFNGACIPGSNLTCVGDTVVANGALRLTPASGGRAGAGYSTEAITLGANSTFSTVFEFRMTEGSSTPADGLAFVLAASTNGLGSTGGGLGYAGVQNSVAIEFDTYNNGGGDNNSSNHVGVDINGSVNSQAIANPYGVVTCNSNVPTPGCMSNGSIWKARISYDGSLLNVFLQEAGSVEEHLISNFAINLGTTLGANSAFVGFSAGTGAAWQNHDILSWSFANDTSLVNGVPEPSALALTGIAILALGASRRRKR